MNVINLSLGDDSNNPLDPTSIAVNNAMLSGVVTVVAAGNSGPNPSTLGSPGASPFAITVEQVIALFPYRNYQVMLDNYNFLT